MNSKIKRRPVLTVAIGLAALFVEFPASAQVARVRLQNHVPKQAIASAKSLGRMNSSDVVELAVPMKLRDQEGLQELIRRQGTPGDAMYGKFITPMQFAASFAPSEADVNAVANELAAEGFTVSKIHDNRMLIEVKAQASQIEKSLGVEFRRYMADDGRVVRASVLNPTVPANIAPLIEGFTGLDSFAKPQSNAGRLRKATEPHPNFGSGVAGGLTPADIKKAYGLNTTTLNGSGQTMAFFEYDGYLMSDLTVYANAAGLTVPPMQNVLLAGYDGSASLPSAQNPNPGSIEVELDLEVGLALMPGATKFVVYESGEGTGSESSFETTWLAMWTRIANDNTASVVSTSWFLATPEASLPATLLNAENSVLMQMASQGQSVFSASGDTGAYFNGTTAFSVSDPGDQPYITSVGGTHIALTADGSYASETSWNDPATQTQSLSGGGGGISSTWALPTWQAGLGSSANLGSTAKRMIPDVSAAADINSGYAIYYDGNWYEVGGTSAAAPLWGAFVGLVNQQRAVAGLGHIGFLNPAIYLIGQSSLYVSTFNDIADGSTNFKYPATAGFDLTTGWGSFKGAALLSALANSVLPPGAPSALTVTGVSQ